MERDVEHGWVLDWAALALPTDRAASRSVRQTACADGRSPVPTWLEGVNGLLSTRGLPSGLRSYPGWRAGVEPTEPLGYTTRTGLKSWVEHAANDASTRLPASGTAPATTSPPLATGHLTGDVLVARTLIGTWYAWKRCPSGSGPTTSDRSAASASRRPSGSSAGTAPT